MNNKIKPAYWRKAVKLLSSKDKIMSGLIVKHQTNNCLIRKYSSFRCFFNIILGQQISIASANAIESKIVRKIKKITPTIFLETSLQTLRECGLSSQKAKYLKGIATILLNQRMFISKLKELDDQELIIELSKIYGIGPWSAEMFLIFYLNRPNILPLQDIGLINSFCKNYNCKRDDFAEKIIAFKKIWDPYCTVATWYLWRDIDNDVVQY